MNNLNICSDLHLHAENDPRHRLQTCIASLDDSLVREQLSDAFDDLNLLWTQQFNRLFDMLNLCQREQDNMQRQLVTQINRYHKAVREVQYYRQKYERAVSHLHLSQQPLPPLPHSHTASYRPPSFMSFPHHRFSIDSSTCSSSTMATSTRWSILSNTRQSFDDLIDEENESIHLETILDSTDLPDIAVSAPSDRLPLDITPSLPEHASTVDPSMTTNGGAENLKASDHGETSVETSVTLTVSNCDQEIPTATPNVSEPLVYACGDGFWDTIARGKNEKEEVEMLVSNYLRRSGKPNVAKPSKTVKMVKEGYGLIHALIVIKNTRALRLVLEAGADVKALPLCRQESDRIPPLLLAAKVRYLKGVRLLLEQGKADLYQRGPQQETVMHVAAQQDATDVARYLLQTTGTVLLETVDAAGATPLHYACMANQTQMITFLIRECHVRADVQDNKGETPLHYAIRHVCPKTVAKLVGDFGVYPNPYVPKLVPTPLDLAKMAGLASIASYLRKMGAKTTKEMEKAAKYPSLTKDVTSFSNVSSVSTLTTFTDSTTSNETYSIISRTSSSGSSAKSRRMILGGKPSIFRSKFDIISHAV